MTAISDLTLVDLAAALKARRLSSREIVDDLLARTARADGKLHAYVEVYAEEARRLADAADMARSAGLPLGPLHGLPIAIKDLCEIEGRVTTGGSKMWEKRVSATTSATVERLLAAGMVPLGKLHMVEFAFGGWGTNPHMGAPWNPWDLAVHRVPGGSSSGTGVAVAARLVPAGIGSDTGGSVRIPAAWCGIVGLKVTHGRISLHGTLLLSHSFDSIGPMARSVEDCALLLQALAGPDPRDPYTLAAPPPEDFVAAAMAPGSIRGARIAFPDAAQLPDFMHKDAVAAWHDAAETFRRLGATVIETRLPDWYFDLSGPAGALISAEALVYHRDWLDDETKPIGPAVRERLRMAKSHRPGAYAEAVMVLRERRRAFAEWFRDHDAVLMPTIAAPAMPLTEVVESAPLPGYLTRPANYLGLCALAMPAGFSAGLPLSVQIVGKPFAETTILRLGRAFQDATAHAKARPDLSALGL